MVGVPGKSKACNTCRRRKIRCDLQRPECQRCIKSGRDCEGYERYPTFIRRSLNGLAKRELLEDAKLPMQLSSTDSQEFGFGTPEEFVPPNVPGTLTKLPIPRQVSNVKSIDQQLAALFIDSYKLQNDNFRGISSDISWVLEAISVVDRDIALRLSIRALSMTRIGWLNEDKNLVMEGRKSYGEALVELQKALKHEHRMLKDEILAAAKALEVYELYEATTPSIGSWHSHVNGVTRLIQLRGPERHQSSLAKAILEHTRYSDMSQSIQFRRKSFFRSLEWRVEPWQDLAQALYDKGLAVAELAENLDNLAHNFNTVISRTEELNRMIEQCVDIDREFEAWLEEFKGPSKYPLFWPVTSASLGHQDDIGMQRGMAYKFVNARVADFMLLYWLLTIVFSMTCQSIRSARRAASHANGMGAESDWYDWYDRADSPEGSTVSSASWAQRAEDMVRNHSDAHILECARHILRSMPYAVRCERSLQVPRPTVFSIRGALLAFTVHGGDDFERADCIGWMDQLTTRKGLGHAKEAYKCSGRWAKSVQRYPGIPAINNSDS